MAKPKQNQRETVRLPRERLDQYFPKNTTLKQIENTIFKALKLLHYLNDYHISRKMVEDVAAEQENKDWLLDVD